MPLTANQIRQLMKADFSPALRAAGFRGSAGQYRRVTSRPYVHLLEFFADKYGARGWFEVAVHVDGFPDTTQGSTTPSEVRIPQVLIRRRVRQRKLLRAKDVELEMGDSEARAADLLRELSGPILRDAEEFFGHYQVFPGALGGLTVNEVLEKRVSWLGDARHAPVPVLLLLSEIHAAQGNAERCQEFARAGLELLATDPNCRLVRLFERILAGSSQFGFTSEDRAEFTEEAARFFDDL